MQMHHSVKAINEMVLAIGDRFVNYKKQDIIENTKSAQYIKTGFQLAGVIVPVTTYMRGYDYIHTKKSKVIDESQARGIIIGEFSGMVYSPERDLSVRVEDIYRDIARCLAKSKTAISIRKKNVRYCDTVDLIISATDTNCVAEISFRSAALFKV